MNWERMDPSYAPMRLGEIEFLVRKVLNSLRKRIGIIFMLPMHGKWDEGCVSMLILIYHLFCLTVPLFNSLFSPWAHRTLMVRAIKGLEEVISVTKVMPVWVKTKPDYETDTHTGWMFANPNGEPRPNSIGLGGPFPSSYPENQPDPELGALTIRELYEKAGDTEGKYSVPVLWDKKLKTIVSNESAEIIRMFNSEFNEFAKYPDINLAPEDMEEGMKAVDDWIYPTINNGVYRCGFAKSQGAYDQAIVELTASFDRIEEILSKQRYIAGDKFTLSDVRLFVTLLRFDEVYVVYFKTNTRTVASSPAILNYLREIYQMQGVKDTVNMDQIKLHYFASHPSLNQWSIIPHGPGTIKQLEKEHNRASL